MSRKHEPAALGIDAVSNHLPSPRSTMYSVLYAQGIRPGCREFLGHFLSFIIGFISR